MERRRVKIVPTILSLVVFAGGFSAAADTAYEVRVKGLGSLTLETEGEVRSVDLGISIPDRGPNKGGIMRDRHQYIDYPTEVRLRREGRPLPETTEYRDAVVNFWSKAGGFNQSVMLLPWFDGYGIYEHDQVEKRIGEWLRLYPLAKDREYLLRFVPDPENDRTLFYLDGSLFSAFKGVRRVTGAKPSGKAALALLSQGAVNLRGGGEELPAVAHRAHPLLEKGAKLSLKPGPQKIKGIPMTVWAPEESIDQGRHDHTARHRSLTSDPMHERSPWKSGPEYFQWRVCGKTWLRAQVLCADIPEEGRLPVVGVNLAKYGAGCSWTSIDSEFTGLTNGVKVGELSYTDGKGRRRLTPLYLVSVPLRIEALGARAKEATALDFEFCGTGTAPWQNKGRRSSVQIFGCTLEEAPYRFRIANPVRGNIFEQGKDEQKSHLEIIASQDGVKGALELDIYGPDHRTLRKGIRRFEIAKAGERFPIDINLKSFDVGWYGLSMKFLGESGAVVATHEAAFTVLAPDDREAGYESPYAAWPHSNGYHGSNPDPMGPRTVMLKAGYRNSWEPPVKSEAEGRPWKLGLNTLGYKCCQPGSPSKTRAEFDARLDRQTAMIREQLAAFPHAQVIQLLHEQGGRDIAPELLGQREPERGEYKGWDFNAGHPEWWKDGSWEVFYCTEWAKRLRREFPDRKIMLGNGSSSSEKIASLIRRGFDLSLVDQLGIESKGFLTPPEMCANREAPGMLWALRETGRAFGYTNFTLNACNEYVFRPERPGDVSAERTVREMMKVTDFTLRDYLISLAHGCTIISTGHLEDAADAYYDTNWGAGGQCTAYPYSYPKRMFTALAVLTRVLDCPKYSRRLPTGEISTFALEFRRERRVKDFAYALWTPEYPVALEVVFPKGAKVTRYETFGKAQTEGTTVRMVADSTPAYLVSTLPAVSARVVKAIGMEPPKDIKPILTPVVANTYIAPKPSLMDAPGPGTPGMKIGRFERADTVLPNGLKGLSLKLLPEGKCPAVITEATEIRFKDRPTFKADEIDGIGVWVKGNGSMSRFRLLFAKAERSTGYPGVVQFSDRCNMNFDGWRYFEARLPSMMNMGRTGTAGETLCLEGMVLGSARSALDPIEMVPVEKDVALGPVYILPKGRLQNKAKAIAAGVEAVMKTVNDKDL